MLFFFILSVKWKWEETVGHTQTDGMNYRHRLNPMQIIFYTWSQGITMIKEATPSGWTTDVATTGCGIFS